IKIQVWTTGRAGIGGVAFAKRPDEVRAHATRMLAMKVGQFPVEAVLVEEKIDIDREFFLSFAIDDAARAPMIIFAAGGGTGIEERASSIIHRLFSNASPTLWNKAIIGAHFISRSWRRLLPKIPKVWLVFMAPAAAAQ